MRSLSYFLNFSNIAFLVLISISSIADPLLVYMSPYFNSVCSWEFHNFHQWSSHLNTFLTRPSLATCLGVSVILVKYFINQSSVSRKRIFCSYMPLLYWLDTGPNIKMFMVALWFEILKGMKHCLCITALLGGDHFRSIHLDFSTK